MISTFSRGMRGNVALANKKDSSLFKASVRLPLLTRVRNEVQDWEKSPDGR